MKPIILEKKENREFLYLQLYETIKEPTSPEDWKFGWNDPGDIGYKEDHGAYLLTLAEPINVLNN